jgi:hypothetical protein
MGDWRVILAVCGGLSLLVGVWLLGEWGQQRSTEEMLKACVAQGKVWVIADEAFNAEQSPHYECRRYE